VLEAAVEVLGTKGSRALTHRAADRAAGLPEGTASNYFRTRDALLIGALEFISASEAGPLLPPQLPDTLEEMADLAAVGIEFMLGPGRTLALARHALFLEAAVNDRLRQGLLDASAPWWQLGTALLTRLGAPDPGRRGRWLFAAIDGLIVDQLARPDPEFDAREAIRPLLSGLAAAPRA